ncbi:hypothetical protein B0T19DRAFT_401028 [Cercophora scortea]|uniref:Uncharacterized protein n=1 Tax=Cercophora scortea TaxID=314031 RepID=A0AAE0MD69_9PEZI|nr:hypothetical protein B0T19DRAFT_401028 [Cercophora scortea]
MAALTSSLLSHICLLVFGLATHSTCATTPTPKLVSMIGTGSGCPGGGAWTSLTGTHFYGNSMQPLYGPGMSPGYQSRSCILTCNITVDRPCKLRVDGNGIRVHGYVPILDSGLNYRFSSEITDPTLDGPSLQATRMNAHSGDLPDEEMLWYTQTSLDVVEC